MRRPRRSRFNLSHTAHTLSSPAATERPISMGAATERSPSVSETPKPPKRGKKLRFRLPKNKKEWAIFAAAAAVVVGGLGFGAYTLFNKSPAPAPVTSQEPSPEPESPASTTAPSKVSGREVELAVNDRPVYAVQIENSPEARPQSGLQQADVVFEAVAEGGITRFNALFHDNQPASIGPIRSLRPYYIDWFLPFDAAIVHAGGSPQALSDVKKLSLKDIEHGVNGGAFTRVSSRYAPHNLYSTSKALNKLLEDKGYTTSRVYSLPRKDPEPATTPSAATIDLAISSTLYNVNFSYDPESNTYLRSQGGTKHKDADSGKQIAPNVVVVPIMGKGINKDGVHTTYNTIGSGKVYVFQDGIVTEGTWEKKDRSKQWQLTDLDGDPISLNPGQTWFTIVDSASKVSYRP